MAKHGIDFIRAKQIWLGDVLEVLSSQDHHSEARYLVPDLLETTVEPIKNPVTGAEHRARIDLPMGKGFQFGEVASGTTRATGAVPLRFAGKHAHLVYNAMTSKGPVAL